MARRIGKTYLYVVSIFSAVILIYSIYILFETLQQQSSDRPESTYFGFFAAGLGIILAVTSLMRVRNRIVLIEKKKSKIFTIVKCNKCDFKMIRDFKTGDFVHKSQGKCNQCTGELAITSIYADKPKKIK